MRMRALFVALLVATAVVIATPAGGQSFTQVSAGLSYGLFDGVGIGLTHYAQLGGIGLGVSVATGIWSGNTPYGIYSERGGRRTGGYSDAYRDAGSSDYCWRKAWDLRWRDNYYGWDGYPSSAYDQYDFYHDCLRSGSAYAYDRWRWHLRSSYRMYARRPFMTVAVLINDPFWRPWGPYWTYDQWGSYWDGYRDGWRDGRRWGLYGGVVYGPAARTAWVGGGRSTGAARPSPLAAPRFKEDPRDVRVATPRAGRGAAPAAAPVAVPTVGERVDRAGVASGRAQPGVTAADRAGAGSRAPAGPATPAVARGRPSDALRPGDGARRPSVTLETARPAPRPAAPVTRPSDGARTARPADGSALRERKPASEPRSQPAPRTAPRSQQPARPSAERRSQPPSTPSVGAAHSRGASEAAPAQRAPATAPRERSGGDRPAVRERSQPESGGRRSAALRPAPAPERSTPAHPSAGRGGGERSAPAVRSGGGEGGRAPAGRFIR